VKSLTRNFIKGLLVLLPITLTVYIAYFLFIRIDRLGRIILSQWIVREDILIGLGFLFTMIFIILAGYVSSFWATSAVLKWIEGQFVRTPFMKGVYGTIRDTVHSLFGEKKFFSQSVLVDLPALGYKRVGFITQDPPEFFEGGEEMIVVYLPHSFQVSGEMIVIPKSRITFLDLPPEAALKLIMSAGIVKN
jgi:uncharacterized membrane protein